MLFIEQKFEFTYYLLIRLCFLYNYLLRTTDSVKIQSLITTYWPFPWKTKNLMSTYYLFTELSSFLVDRKFSLQKKPSKNIIFSNIRDLFEVSFKFLMLTVVSSA